MYTRAPHRRPANPSRSPSIRKMPVQSGAGAPFSSSPKSAPVTATRQVRSATTPGPDSAHSSAAAPQVLDGREHAGLLDPQHGPGRHVGPPFELVTAKNFTRSPVRSSDGGS